MRILVLVLSTSLEILKASVVALATLVGMCGAAFAVWVCLWGVIEFCLGR